MSGNDDTAMTPTPFSAEPLAFAGVRGCQICPPGGVLPCDEPLDAFIRSKAAPPPLSVPRWWGFSPASGSSCWSPPPSSCWPRPSCCAASASAAKATTTRCRPKRRRREVERRAASRMGHLLLLLSVSGFLFSFFFFNSRLHVVLRPPRQL